MRNNLLIRFIVLEYVTMLIILQVCFNYKIIKSLEKAEELNKQQQYTINTLVTMLKESAEVQIVEAEESTEEVIKEEVKNTPAAQVKNTKSNKGTFRITAYCSCEKCCGKWASVNGGGITASGTKVKEGRTIAVCKSQIPFGTEVYIEGMGTYIAEDTGSAIKENCIDVYFDSHEEAWNFGVKKLNVEW